MVVAVVLPRCGTTPVVSAEVSCNLATQVSEGVGMEPSPQFRFTQLWMQAQPVVVSVLTAQLRDRTAVEDVMQEVALAAFQALPGFDERRSFTGWVVGIAQHKAVDWLRRNGPRRSGAVSYTHLNSSDEGTALYGTPMTATCTCGQSCLLYTSRCV